MDSQRSGLARLSSPWVGRIVRLWVAMAAAIALAFNFLRDLHG
jgi:hypothetical protein